MPSENLNIVIAGVGGQGTVLASKLLASCALSAGMQVRSAETIGMAQRGGSVLGHVRINSTESPEVNSPLVPQATADILIGFEPAETVKALPYLREGATVVSAIKALAPPTATLQRLSYDGSQQLEYLKKLRTDGWLGQLILVDGEQITAELGSNKVLNVVLLGATVQTLDNSVLSAESLKATLKLLVKPQFYELNIKALDLGVKAWR